MTRMMWRASIITEAEGDMSFGHFHPGVTLDEELEARGVTAAAHRRATHLQRYRANGL
jgi:hypothetical protein